MSAPKDPIKYEQWKQNLSKAKMGKPKKEAVSDITKQKLSESAKRRHQRYRDEIQQLTERIAQLEQNNKITS